MSNGPHVSKLADQYVNDHCNKWDNRSPEYTNVEEAFIAGWRARGKADFAIVNEWQGSQHKIEELIEALDG